jgi:RNA polymerase-binding protein DksA
MATVRKTTRTKSSARATKMSSRKAKNRSTRPAARKRTIVSNGKNGSATKTVKPVLNQKELLKQERLQVETDLANFRAQLQEAPEKTGDEVDLNVYEREKTLGLVAAYERRLEEIDAALRAAEQGTYGICERCGNPIDRERLQIFPETRLCVSCKNQVEQEQRRLRP